MARDIIGARLGVLGPSALGGNLRNGFHNLIGDQASMGWADQIKDLPVVQLVTGRTWRYDSGLRPFAGFETDVLPSVSAEIGTLRDYAQIGARVRIGQGLDSDFGSPRIRPGLSGMDAYTPTLGFVWYAFACIDAQAVAWYATLDGNPFAVGPHVANQALVGEPEGGIAIIWHGVHLTWTHVAQTPTFHGQSHEFFQFDSFAAAVRF